MPLPILIIEGTLGRFRWKSFGNTILYLFWDLQKHG